MRASKRSFLTTTSLMCASAVLTPVLMFAMSPATDCPTDAATPAVALAIAFVTASCTMHVMRACTSSPSASISGAGPAGINSAASSVRAFLACEGSSPAISQ